MPYVKARLAPPMPEGFGASDEPGKRRVVATDENGTEWWLTEDSQVGDWLRFIEAGGKVEEE